MDGRSMYAKKERGALMREYGEYSGSLEK